MNSNDLINEFFSKLYSGNINEFNKFIENNNLSANIKNNNNENALHIIVKSDLSDILVESMRPITAEINRLMQDKAYLMDILREGQNKANEVAKKTINDVYDIVGLLRNET